jgi:hypothetical protein
MSKQQSPVQIFLDGLSPIKTWKKVLLAVAALLSLAFTHYVGFLIRLPDTIREIAAERFAASYSSTFALSAATAYAIGRILTIALVPIIVLLAATLLRLVIWRSRLFARKFIRLRRFAEAAAPFLTALLAVLIFVSLYTPGAGLLQFSNAFILIVIGGFLTSPALPSLLKSRTTQWQTGSPKELSRRPAVVAAMLGWVVAALLVCSLILGAERFRHLASGPTYELSTPCIRRAAVVLLNTGDQFLALAHEADGAPEFIVAGATFAVSSSASAPLQSCSQ